MYYVYLLQSLKDKKYYIGQTDNVMERLKKHNNKEVESTRNRVPFSLVGYEEYKTRNEARWREYNLKESAWQRKKFIKTFINIIVIIFVFLISPFLVLASSTDGTIDATYKYAWSENIGWLNFGATNGNVHVTDSGLSGYALSENVGWINLSGITNDGEGNLSGTAWSENTGWINFKPTNGGVIINSSGEFTGSALSENTGWIIFAGDYKVKTDYRPQSARPDCNNSSDDDSDGKTDYPNDPGCSSLEDTDETDATAALSSGSLPPGAYNVPIIPIGGYKVSTNSGSSLTSSVTSSRIVSLNFDAGSDIKKMAISMTGDFKDASTENYSPTKQIDLCSKFGGLIKNSTCPDGEYTVYVKFYTKYYMGSDVVSTKVNLVTNPQSSNQNSSPTAGFRLGSTNSQIKSAQQFLNQNGYKLTDTGPGSPENETNYFGSLTYKALIKFQEANKDKVPGIINEKGYLGPITLQLISLPVKTTAPTSLNDQKQDIPSAMFTTSLYKGITSQDVRRLQTLLSTKPDIYPDGLITGFFGSLTEKAIQIFQLKYGVVSSKSDQGFGVVGPKTTAKILEVFGK